MIYCIWFSRSLGVRERFPFQSPPSSLGGRGIRIMIQKILFQIEGDYDPKDIRDLIGNYDTEDEKIIVSEKQLAILVLVYKGAQYWYQNRKLHRENDLPAIIGENGSQEWYKNGKRHRDNLPAVIYPDVMQFWCRNGNLHREKDLPAVIHV